MLFPGNSFSHSADKCSKHALWKLQQWLWFCVPRFGSALQVSSLKCQWNWKIAFTVRGPRTEGSHECLPKVLKKKRDDLKKQRSYYIVGVFLVLYLWVDSKKLNNIHCLLTHSKGDLLICDHLLKFLMNKRVESEIEGKKEISDHFTNRDFLQVQELTSWYPLDSSTDWQSDQGGAM